MEQKLTRKQFLFKCLKAGFFVGLGSLILAFGIVNFSMTSSLASGGMTGVTLIFYHTLGISPAISTVVINVPLLLIFWKYSSKYVFFLTIWGIATLSGAIDLFERLGPLLPDLTNDMILAAVGFGVCIGVGTGLIVQQEGTSGGAIIIARLLKEKLGIPYTKTFMVFDGVVILASMIFFVSVRDVFYSLIALYISVITLAKVQEGFISGYKVLIFSQHNDQIAPLIHGRLNRGATYIQAYGAYTGNERKILLVIIDNKQLVQLKRLVHEVDPTCFISVEHTYETLGEGFTYKATKRLERMGEPMIDGEPIVMME